MTVPYDKYYQTENLFGEPYPELIAFFSEYHNKKTVLDLGCGQGRNAIPLSRLGYSVSGIDNSKIGIEQMNQVGRQENLQLTGQVGDIYAFDRFSEFDIILSDSMFHFAKKDKQKEVALIKRIMADVKQGALVVICIQNTGDKVDVLNQAVDSKEYCQVLANKDFKYVFEDKESGHQSETDYKMIIIEK